MIRSTRFQICVMLLAGLVVSGWFDSAAARCMAGDISVGQITPADAVLCVGQRVDWASRVCFKPCDPNYVRPACYWDVPVYDEDSKNDPEVVIDGWCVDFSISGPAYRTVPGGIVFDEPGTGTLSAVVSQLDPPCPGCEDTNIPQPTQVSFTVIRVTMTNPHGDPTDSDEAAEDANEFTFNGANPGVCMIECTATIEPDNEFTQNWAKENVSWSISPGVAGSNAQWTGPNGNMGLATALQYTGLPASNDSFGNDVITMSTCTPQQNNIQVFYAQGAKNHSGGDSSTVNWHHYYSQTPASAGVPYDPTFRFPNKGGYAKWDPIAGQWVAFLDWGGNVPTNRTTWDDPAFIDSFAWLSRHELRHVAQMVGFWDNGDRVPALDVDGDSIPDVLESVYGRGNYSPFTLATYPDEVDYGENPVPDYEDICMRADEAPWSVVQLWQNDQGSIVEQDWANFGKQHKL